MKILWTSGTSRRYYTTVSSNTLPSWKYLDGDKKIYTDQDMLIGGINTETVNFNYWPEPSDLTPSEYKFYRKSRSIVSALKGSIGQYDYLIWLDGDVEVITKPHLPKILPRKDQVLSTIKKFSKNGTGLDSGFIAFNLKHKKIHNLLFEYTQYWQLEKLNDLPYRYDACVLEKILENYNWKNLINEDYNGIKDKKNHCGFEGSELENYFYHYWGKKQKQQQFS